MPVYSDSVILMYFFDHLDANCVIYLVEGGEHARRDCG
jgi:hypothetical protein